MTIDWLPFLIAVLLLWLPRQVLRLGGKVLRFGGRRRKIRDTNPAHVREHGDPAVSLREEIAKPRNTIDLLRATLGSVVILGAFEGIEPALRAGPGADAAELQRVFFLQIAVLLAGVLIQTFRYEGRLTLFAPIFYLSGLTFGMCGFYPALFALVLVWTINLGLPNANPQNIHLDSANGRYWMRLEWRALARALATGDKSAVADALAFRAERRKLVTNDEERLLEMNERVQN